MRKGNVFTGVCPFTGGIPVPGYPWQGLGYPCLGLGEPHPSGQDWGTPQKGPGARDLGNNLGLGYHPPKKRHGTRALRKNLELGYPPGEQTDTCENISFPIFRMRVGIMKDSH